MSSESSVYNTGSYCKGIKREEWSAGCVDVCGRISPLKARSGRLCCCSIYRNRGLDQLCSEGERSEVRVVGGGFGLLQRAKEDCAVEY